MEGEIRPTIVQSATFDSYNYYYIINNDIRVTKRHPFLTNKKNTDTWAWIDPPDLEIGDRLKGMNEDMIEIITLEGVDDIIHVKTLNVETVDNYFAGQTAVLIHNDLVKA